jgi:hypothetical protein
MRNAVIDKVAKDVLGDTYGGPSLSWDKEKKEFVVYYWYDAPVGEEELGRGKTILSALRAALITMESKNAQ